MNPCPSSEQLELLLYEQLSDAESETIVAHVEDCVPCQEQLERLVAEPVSCAPSSERYLPEFDPPEAFLDRLKEIPPRAPARSELSTSGRSDSTHRSHSDQSVSLDRVDQFERRRLGQYEILEKIGQGSMGVVYKAMHVELGKLVALKVLPAERMDEVTIARFKHEVRAIGKLDHPNIVGTHDAGQLQGTHFLVMAYVDGTDLARLLDHHGQLSIPDACEIIRQAAVGLQHAFERGLVHRDIKPSNLVLARDGVVKVLDLGIARSLTDTPTLDRLTATGMLLGTADYLAPEQWEHPHLVDARADVYSLGCTLYHLIAGNPPFAGPEFRFVVNKMRAHLEEPVPPIATRRPDVPARLADVLERMLAKNPADRFPTPGEIATELRPFTAGANLVALLDLDTRAKGVPSLTPGGSDVESPTLTHVGQRPPSRAEGKSARGTKRSFTVLLAAVSLCVALGIAIAFWPIFQRPELPPLPLSILSMHVSQYRGQNALFLGEVGSTAHEIRPDDAVRVSVKLSRPAYCYLIAFNPDGSEQLCFPEDPDLAAVIYPEHKDQAHAMATPPAQCTELRYPRDQYFEPGFAGLQTFVLIASINPLPPYAKWRSQLGSIPWSQVSYEEIWRWQFDGREFTRLPSERGLRVQRGAPAEFEKLCRSLQSLARIDSFQAVAFPVADNTAKDAH